MTNARTLVGEASPSDRLDPVATAATLPPDAPLRAILQSAAVITLHAQRSEASAAARRAQRSHRRLSMAAMVGGAVAAISSGLLLVASDAATTTAAEAAIRHFAQSARVAIIVCQVAGLGTSAFAASVLAAMNYGKRWTEARGRAEDGRIKLVERVLRAGEAAGGDGQAYAQSFEYFRRYQLELQLGYQRRQLAHIDGRQERTAFSVAGLTAVAAVGGLIGAVSDPWAIVGAFLGIAVPVLLNASRSWSKIDGSGGLDSTRAAKEQLEEQMTQLDDVRRSVEAGDTAAVRGFVGRIHDILRVESGAWAGRLTAAPDDGGTAAADKP